MKPTEGQEAMPLRHFTTFSYPRFRLTCRLGALLVLILATPLSGQIVPPATAQARPEQAGPPEETNIYLVTFQPGTTAVGRAAVVQGVGAVLRRNFNVVNAVSVDNII